MTKKRNGDASKIELMRVTNWTLKNCGICWVAAKRKCHLAEHELKTKSNVQFETFVNYLMRWFEWNYFARLSQIQNVPVPSSSAPTLTSPSRVKTLHSQSIGFTLSCSNFRWHTTITRKLHKCTYQHELRRFPPFRTLNFLLFIFLVRRNWQGRMFLLLLFIFLNQQSCGSSLLLCWSIISWHLRSMGYDMRCAMSSLA